MSSHRDRVAAALAHERPDRCPLQVSFTPEFAERLRTELGIDSDALHNPHGGGNSYVLETAVGEDLLLTSVGWANSYYGSAGEHYVDEWGIGWRAIPYSTRYGKGVYTEIVDHPLSNERDVAHYRAPDPLRPALYLDAERTIAKFGAEYWIVGVVVTTIFETAWALRGMEELLTDFLVDSDLADAILDIPYRYHRAAAKRLVELGVDMIWTGDDVGTQRGMLISPELWRRYLKPRLAELFAELKRIRPSLTIAYHSDGDIEPIIPDLIEIGLDVLNPIQPACMDPARIAKKYGKRLTLWGTIDEQKTLPFGKPHDVAREVAERIETVGASGGLIIAPTHHVQLDTPMRNFLALVEAVTGERPREVRTRHEERS